MDNSQDIAELKAKLDWYRDIVEEMREALKLTLQDLEPCGCPPDDKWCVRNRAQAALKRLEEE